MLTGLAVTILKLLLILYCGERQTQVLEISSILKSSSRSSYGAPRRGHPAYFYLHLHKSTLQTFQVFARLLLYYIVFDDTE